VALEWARGSASRHLALRSVQVFRALRQELSLPVLADLLQCASAAAASPSRWALALLGEIQGAVADAVARLEPSRVLLFPQLFWAAVAEVQSGSAHVFLAGASLLAAMLRAVDVSSPTVQNVLLSSMPPSVLSGRGALGLVVPPLVRGLASPRAAVQGAALSAACSLVPVLFTSLGADDLFAGCEAHVCALLLSLAAWAHAAPSEGGAPDAALETLRAAFAAIPPSRASQGLQAALLRLVRAAGGGGRRAAGGGGASPPPPHDPPRDPRLSLVGAPLSHAPSGVSGWGGLASVASVASAASGAEAAPPAGDPDALAALAGVVAEVAEAFLAPGDDPEAADGALGALGLLASCRERPALQRAAMATCRLGVLASGALASHPGLQGILDTALSPGEELQAEALALVETLVQAGGADAAGAGAGAGWEARGTMRWDPGDDEVAVRLNEVLRTFPGRKYAGTEEAAGLRCLGGAGGGVPAGG